MVVPGHSTEPSEDEVFQAEPPEQNIVPVPVAVDGPVRVQELPSPVWSRVSRVITTEPELILSPDPKRRRVVMVTNGFFKFGPSSELTRSQPVPWPGDKIPAEMLHAGEVWACANAGTIELNVIIENWAN
jgi:hypothetical protein